MYNILFMIMMPHLLLPADACCCKRNPETPELAELSHNGDGDDD